MAFELKPPRNPNYCAQVVTLRTFRDLAGCDNVKAAFIQGQQVIVGKDTPEGAVGLFFPAETALSTEFLHHNNLHRDKTLNADKTVGGFFEAHGRVRTMKFRGHKSEGFWIPLNALNYCGGILLPLELQVEEGNDFDFWGEYEICRKYVSRRNPGKTQSTKGNKPRKNLLDRVSGQFRFHEDTAQLRRNIHKLSPETWITITDKWHGTSVVLSNVLVEHDFASWLWYKRALRAASSWLGVPVEGRAYSLVWSSRRVIKGIGEAKTATHKEYYSVDVYSSIAERYGNRIPKGYTVYGEIVGWAGGSQIQKDYTYGFQQGTNELFVYRVSVTNADGEVMELSQKQLETFCRTYGFNLLPLFYHGPAVDFCFKNKVQEPGSVWTRLGDLAVADEVLWREKWLDELYKKHVDGRMTEFDAGLPAEGVVVRFEDSSSWEAYKLKSFEFLERETRENDAGTVDIEAAESDNNEEDEKENIPNA